MCANALMSLMLLLFGEQLRRDRLPRHRFLCRLMWLAKFDAQVGTVSATIWPFLTLRGLSSVTSCFCPRAPASFTTGLWRRSLYLVLPLCLITAIRAVGVLPYLLDLNRLPKKSRCDFLGLERSIAQATSLPLWWTFIGRLWPSATRGKPVTLPMPSQGCCAVSFGQSGAGVCFVLPSTIACLAPANETATTPTSAAHNAAKARAWRARCRRPVVDCVVPVIWCFNTARRAWFAAPEEQAQRGPGCGATA